MEHTLADLLNNLDRCRDLSNYNKKNIKNHWKLHAIEANRLVQEEANALIKKYRLENPLLHSSTINVKI